MPDQYRGMKADRLPWFPCEPGKLLGALASMKPDQQLVYTTILLRIYEIGAPCPDTLDAIARRIGINKRRTVEALDALFKAGKLLQELAGISNPYATEVLAQRATTRSELVRAGREGASRRWGKTKQNHKTADSQPIARPMAFDADIHRHSPFPRGKGPASDGDLFNSQAKTPPKETKVDAETELFRRGKEVLGQSAGGMIANLLRSKEGNVALARAAIEQGSTKESPREFIGAIINKQPPSKRGGNGYARLAARLAMETGEDHDERIDDGQTDHRLRVISDRT